MNKIIKNLFKNSLLIFVIVFNYLPILHINNVYCASFDCSKAKSKIEKAICANPKASKLDEELNMLYKKVMSSFNLDEQKIMYYEQMQWLQALLEKKTPREIIDIYKQRIAEIKQFK